MPTTSPPAAGTVSAVIDPGHGGSAAAGKSTPTGARGPGGTLEKEVTLALASRIAQRLGTAAALTRQTDANSTLADRMELARRRGARVFLSLHANSGAPGTRGAESYVHSLAGERSARLAQHIQEGLRALGRATVPVARAEMAVLTPARLAADTAACLLEVDYLSDPQGEQELRDPQVLDGIARAIADAIQAHLLESSAEAEVAALHAPTSQAQAGPVAIIGLGIAIFGVLRAVADMASGDFTWSRNIVNAIHQYPAGTRRSEAWQDGSRNVLWLSAISGLSSVFAFFSVHWRYNGKDIDQCRVELNRSSDFTVSSLSVAFEGREASSYERDEVAAIMIFIQGTFDPAGSGDADFSCQVLVKADGTTQNLRFNIGRGDQSDWEVSEPDFGGYKLRKV